MTTASITYWAPILNENYSNPQVLNMFPFSGADSRSVVFYALVYTSLFLIGICGNISTITLIRHVHSAIPYDNTMLYVLFLCGVDLISVIPLPMAISDQLLGFWIFGSVVCKIYRTLEHVGRALSTFVLAAMAYDRFLKVCYPHHKTSRGSAICTLATLTFVTFVLLSPMIAYALSEEIILREVYVHNPDRVLRVKIYKCLDNMEGDLFTVFTLYMFVLGFAIPVSLIVLFYGLLVRRLFLRSRSIATSQVPVNRIAGYTMAISIFFVVCWSPYWMATLYGLYRSTKKVAFHASPTFIYVMYGIHALPYVNSASNWLLYGMLNGQLMRRANVHRQTMKNVHNNVNSLVLKKALSPSEKNDCDDSIIVPRTSDSLL